MKINKEITDLKKKLEDVYNNLRERTDPESWKAVIGPAYQADPVQTSILVVDFLQLHRYMPAECVRTAADAIDLRNAPSMMADVFSADIVNRILDDMSGSDVISYDHISSDYSESQIRDIINTAGEVKKRMSQLQVYISGKQLEKLKRYCPVHPDVLELQRESAGLKNNMISCLRDIVRRDDVSAREAAERQVSAEKEALLISEGKISDAVEYYEELLTSDPMRTYAYYRVGKLYLETGNREKADYMAALIFEKTDRKVEAYTLKGLVLEEEEKFEDALFYYSSACRKDPGFRDALRGRIRMIKKLDGEAASRFFDEEDVNEEKEDKIISIKSSPKYIKDIDAVLDEIDDMLRRGRMSEAYYEIQHCAEKHKEYEILSFAKGFTLYMMKKYHDAREIFRGLSGSEIFGRYAEWMAEDIDHRIVDSGIFDGFSMPETAAVYYDAGMPGRALEIISKLPKNNMTAEISAMSGRCEIEVGDMDAAYDAFEKALRLDPEIKNVREMLGMISQARGMVDTALDYYGQAIEKDGAPETACVMKAGILYDRDENEVLLDYCKTVRELLNRDSDADGYAGLVMTERFPRNTERGAAYLQRAVSAGSEKTDFYVSLINVFMNSGMENAALQFTEDGFFNVTSTKELFMKKAEILFKLKKYTAADLITGMLLSAHPDSPELQYIKGMICSERGEEKNAVRWLRSAAQGDTSIHRFATALADKYFDLGEMNNALEFYTRAVALDENDSVSLKRRAFIYRTQGDTDAAIRDIERAMKIDPEDAEIYLIIGDILKDPDGYKLPEELRAAVDSDPAKDPEEGDVTSGESAEEQSGTDLNDAGTEEPFEEEPVSEEDTPQASDDAEDTDNSDAEPEVTPGSAEAEVGPSEEKDEDQGFERSSLLKDMDRDSEFYFTKALELDPQYRQAYMTRARYYAERGQKKEALADIARAIDLDPDEMDAYMVRGVIHHILGMDEEAVIDFRKVAKNDFMVTQAYSYISNCLNTMGQYRESVEAANAGISYDQDYLNLYLNRGIAYYGLEKYETAVDDFRRVISKRNEIDSNTVAAAYRFRGLCYEKMGDSVSAMHDYRLLIKYDPDQNEIRARLEALERKNEEESRPTGRFSGIRSLFSKKK